MRWKYVVPLVVFLGLVVLFAVGFRLNPREIPSPLIGKTAPHFTLPRFAEPAVTVTPAAWAGKPYLLNVWATWCVSCRQEHATLMRLKQEGVRIIGFNYKEIRGDAGLDARKLSPEAEAQLAWQRIGAWLKTGGDPYADLVVDLTGRAAIDYGVYGTPETFFIDAKGVIRYKHIGPITPEVWQNQLRAKWLALQEGS
ncbi:MAG: DsbE family thiol:disulfide interchange protein [Hydrogenophilus thermoluteolus]|nr:DsbE family thiol:disulfide interchange protein [Hydrogenophilus thermoluteolus]